MTTTLEIVTPSGPYSVGIIAPGTAGVDQTIGAMLALIADGQRRSGVRTFARLFLHPIDLHVYLRERFRFRADPRGVERITAADVNAYNLIDEGQAEGDCDDLAVLGAATLGAMGRWPVLITAGRTAGGRLEHVFFGHKRNPRAGLSMSNVVPMDPQEGYGYGVWPRVSRVRLHRATGEHR